MRIVGEWLECDDGVTRPIVRANVLNVGGQFIAERFLIDTGADRTVLSGDLLQDLRLSAISPSSSGTLMGVGGITTFALISTAIELTRDDGGPATIRGEFAAFTDLRATDLSILGRDVLDNFAVIVSRRRNESLLLAPNHRYDVVRR
jgi:hypothetical protein